MNQKVNNALHVVLALTVILSIYLGIFYAINYGIQWEFLFVYQNELIKYIGAFIIGCLCIYFAFNIKFKDEEKWNDFMLRLMRIVISIILFIAFYGAIYTTALAHVFYRTAKDSYSDKMVVSKILGEYSKSKTIEFKTSNNELFKLEWNYLMMRNKLDNDKPEISIINRLHPNDTVMIYGRKNFTGVAIDSIRIAHD